MNRITDKKQFILASRVTTVDVGQGYTVGVRPAPIGMLMAVAAADDSDKVTAAANLAAAVTVDSEGKLLFASGSEAMEFLSAEQLNLIVDEVGKQADSGRAEKNSASSQSSASG